MATNPSIKRPAEVRRYAVNFGNHPELRDNGETLSSPTLAVSPSGLTAVSPAISGQRALFTGSGGADGVDYDVAVTVVTSGGATLQETVTIQVRVK